MARLVEIDYSEIKQDQMYIVQKAEDDEQTAIESEIETLSGDEIISELRELFRDTDSEDIYEMLLRFEAEGLDEGVYRVFDIPGFIK